MELAATHCAGQSDVRIQPELRDYWLFFVGIPAAMAFLFSLIGIKLIAGMPYLDGFLYMLLHMFIAWWSTALGTTLMRRLSLPRRVPVAVLVTLGFIVCLPPTAFVFSQLGDLFASAYPVFAENRSAKALPGWSLEYVAHFARYSTPAIPLFLVGVFGYRYATGVEWFAYPEAAVQPQTAGERGAAEGAIPLTDVAELAPGAAEQPDLRVVPPLAGAIAGSRLPSDAEIFAIKAEQHYIKIWSEAGTDLVRYRFRDLADEFADCNAAQVHRSWWVNFDRVGQVRRAGRSIELVVDDEMVVPVSLSHKTAVLSAVNKAPR